MQNYNINKEDAYKNSIALPVVGQNILVEGFSKY